MKSFYRRQLALMLGIVFLSFSLLSAVFTLVSYRYVIEEKKDSMLHNAQYISEFTGTYLEQGNIRDGFFKLYVTSLAQISGAHVMLCETDGEIVFATDGSAKNYQYSKHVPNQILRFVSERGKYMGMTDLGGIYSENRFLAAAPVFGQVSPRQVLRGVVLVSTSAGGISQLWRAMSNIFFFTAVAVLVISVVASSISTARQTRPLNEIAEAARKFGHGDFSVRIRGYEQRQDEVGSLAEAFNAMAGSLEKTESQRNEFIANVSHELKTPMTTIAGFADGILDGTIPPERERESLQVIASETRRLSRLVRQMLDLSRLRALEEKNPVQERFDVSEVMLRVLVSLESKISAAGLDVRTNVPEQPVMVWGDPDGVTQVCYNLLDNAAKFAREGSDITVQVVTRDGKAYISVRNLGETIPAEELPRLFERFHKTDHSRSRDRDGVGLGLYIVKTILGSMKEDITVTSENGVTEFTFTLSLA
ncbi:MAG: HAMP domain-containing histidine kinase [Oscillospiraceae bacterium]|nr:HAMP domain-containing histidine kinase [Oscillospiraceae bacterium]